MRTSCGARRPRTGPTAREKSQPTNQTINRMIRCKIELYGTGARRTSFLRRTGRPVFEARILPLSRLLAASGLGLFLNVDSQPLLHVDHRETEPGAHDGGQAVLPGLCARDQKWSNPQCLLAATLLQVCCPWARPVTCNQSYTEMQPETMYQRASAIFWIASRLMRPCFSSITTHWRHNTYAMAGTVRECVEKGGVIPLARSKRATSVSYHLSIIASWAWVGSHA